MDRVAVFVDAGYLFAQGSVALCGEKLTRREIVLDHGAVIAKLKVFAETHADLHLLRIYWNPRFLAGANRAVLSILGSESHGR